jgi:hypothetical protein
MNKIFCLSTISFGFLKAKIELISLADLINLEEPLKIIEFPGLAIGGGDLYQA